MAVLLGSVWSTRMHCNWAADRSLFLCLQRILLHCGSCIFVSVFAENTFTLRQLYLCFCVCREYFYTAAAVSLFLCLQRILLHCGSCIFVSVFAENTFTLRQLYLCFCVCREYFYTAAAVSLFLEPVLFLSQLAESGCVQLLIVWPMYKACALLTSEFGSAVSWKKNKLISLDLCVWKQLKYIGR